MIVRYSEQGWQIVTQRAHGILAAEIGLQWKRKEQPTRWLETLLAIAEHDDAEIELDGENLLTEQGGPLNYAMKRFELAHCEKIQRMTVTKSRYIQLLTSLHMEFLYGKEAGINKVAQRFLKEQKKLRDQLTLEIKMKKSVVKKIYDFVEWCDAFSLLLCEDQIQPEKRMTQISTGADRQAFQVFTLKSGWLSVDPWPFEAAHFTLRFEQRRLSDLSFPSSAAFRTAFLAAPVSVKVWHMAKKPAGFRRPGKLQR